MGFEELKKRAKDWMKDLPTRPSASVTPKTEEGMIIDRLRKTFETGVVNAEIGMFRWTGKGPEDTKSEDVPIWQRQQVREIVEEMGGEATVHAGLSVDLTWPTPNKRMQSIRELKHTLLYARDIKANVVTVHPTTMQGGNAFFDTVLFTPETRAPWYGGGEAEMSQRNETADQVGWYTPQYFKRMEAWRKAHMRRTLEQAFGKGAAEVDAAIYSTGIELYMKFLQGMTQLFGFYKEAKENHLPMAIAQEHFNNFVHMSAKIAENPKLSEEEKKAEITALAKAGFRSALSDRGPYQDASPAHVRPYAERAFAPFLSGGAGGGAGGGPGADPNVVDAVGKQLAAVKEQIANDQGVDVNQLTLTPDLVEDYLLKDGKTGLKHLREQANKWNPGLRGFDARYKPITEKTFLTTLTKSFEILLDDEDIKSVLNEGETKIGLENMEMTNLATGVLGSPYFSQPIHFKKALKQIWAIAKRKGIKNPEKVIGMTYDILHASTGKDPVKFMEDLQKPEVDPETGEKLPGVPLFNVHVSGGPINAYGGTAHQHVAMGSRGDAITQKHPRLMDDIKKKLKEAKSKGLIDDVPVITIEPGEGGTEDTEQTLANWVTAGSEPFYAKYGAELGVAKEWGYDQASSEYYKEKAEQQSLSEYPDEGLYSAMDRSFLYQGARATFMESLYSQGGAQKGVAPGMWAGGMSHRDVAQLPKPWAERFYFTGQSDS